MRTTYGEMDLAVDERTGRARVRAGIRGRATRHAEAAPIHPCFKSNLEAAYSRQLDVLQAIGEIRAWYYEPCNLRLPGEKNFYKPDFLIERPSGRIEIHETKGHGKNRREGITKTKTAAGVHRWATFVLIEREKGRFIERPLKTA